MKTKFILTLSCLLSIGAQAQNKVYVDASATGTNNGSSWTNAYTSLSTALLHADSVLSIDTILVAQGTYHPEHQVSSNFTTDRYKALMIKRSNLAVIGGYASGGTTYDPDQYKAVVSGNIGNQQDSTDNSYKLLYIIGSSNAPKINNIYIANLEFRDAHANSNYEGFYLGSNMFNINNGGAIAIHYANTEFDNVIFENNYSMNAGGGMFTIDSDIRISNSIFSKNKSDKAGGISCESGDLAILEKVKFISNTTSFQGGAANISNFKKTIINQSEFNNNSANYSSQSNHLVDIDTLNYTNNTVINHNYNPIINIFGRIRLLDHSNNIYANNIDTLSSSMFNLYSSMNYIDNISNIINNNNTYINNQAKVGAYFMNFNNIQSFRNNIYYNNTFNNIANLTLNNFTNNYVQHDSTTANNLDGRLDPMFVKYDTIYENGNFRLQFCSPLLNVGDTTGITATVDLLGNPRVAGSTIDLGAYEKQSDSIIANNGTLASATDNGIALLPTCEEDAWTYYAPISNPDSVVMAIKWDSTNAIAKANAIVSMQVDSNYTLVSNATTGIASARTYWHVDIDTHSINTPVSIKYYYANDDITALTSALTTAGLDSINTPTWFVMDEAFVPVTQVTAADINTGNYTVVTPNIGTINGFNYAIIDSLTNFSSGGVFVKGSKKPTSLNHYTPELGITIAPNPTSGVLNLTVNNQAWLGNTAYVVDLHGRIISTFTVQANNTIEVYHLPIGMYSIQIGGHHIKFVKQ